MGARNGDVVKAVNGISYTLNEGESMAIVGESGSGKSVSALSVLKLLPYPMASHPSGKILFHGADLLGTGVLGLCRGRRLLGRIVAVTGTVAVAPARDDDHRHGTNDQNQNAVVLEERVVNDPKE